MSSQIITRESAPQLLGIGDRDADAARIHNHSAVFEQDGVQAPTGVGNCGLPIDANVISSTPRWGRWCGAGRGRGRSRPDSVDADGEYVIC